MKQSKKDIITYDDLAGDFAAEVHRTESPTTNGYFLRLWEGGFVVSQPVIVFDTPDTAYHYALGYADAAEDYQI